MRPFVFLVAVVAACSLAACGGGQPIVPPPPSGGFLNTSLTGHYAFSMTGASANCSPGVSCGAYVARVGSFFADGSGNITAAIEDVVDLGSGLPPVLVTFVSGVYSIQPNGRGVIALQASDGGILQLNLTMQSSSQGFLVETDLRATTSGSFNLQTTADFATTAIKNNYAFDFSGVSFSATSAAPISILGQIVTDGAGNITGGTQDVNDGNASAPAGPLPVPPGTYQLDSGATGTNFGRATMTLGTRSFVFYIVDTTHLKLLEEDSLGGTSGEALQQSANLPVQNSSFSGSFAFLLGGNQTSGTTGPLARAARFTSDGNGGIGAISFDSNSNGNVVRISQGSNISAATYAIDSSLPGSGRGTFTFTASGQGTFQYVFYLISPAQGFVQETSKGVIGDGALLAQTGGPFALSGTAGNYAFSWTGVALPTSGGIPFDENFVGQYVLSTGSSNNMSGVVDYTQLGLSADSFFTNVGVAGTLTIKNDGTVANNMRVALGGSSTTTINFAAYIVNSQTMILLSTDNMHVTAGFALRQ